MIRLYTWTTPNGRKIPIALEELELDYSVNPVDIGEDEQFSEAFSRLSPYNKIPVIVDEDAGDLTVFESGAILVYLAEKTGRLLPKAGAERYRTLAWLELQVGGIGPMFGQLGHFALHSEDEDKPAIRRYVGQVERLLNVLEKRLGESEYLAGDVFSIADIATYPWVKSAVDQFGSVMPPPLDSRSDLARWLQTVGARPSVRRGMDIPASP